MHEVFVVWGFLLSFGLFFVIEVNMKPFSGRNSQFKMEGGTEVSGECWEEEEMSLKCSCRAWFLPFLFGGWAAISVGFCVSFLWDLVFLSI